MHSDTCTHLTPPLMASNDEENVEELLKALEGGKALRAASLSFRFWQ